jgi:hypothetical protein
MEHFGLGMFRKSPTVSDSGTDSDETYAYSEEAYARRTGEIPNPSGSRGGDRTAGPVSGRALPYITPYRDPVLDAADDVEAYLQHIRVGETPLSDAVHRAAKHGSRITAGPSDTGAPRSKISDKGSRASRVANVGGDQIRLRVDASSPLSLQFSGDMAGRSPQIQPTEDGMVDIVFENQRGEKRTDSSKGDSVVGSGKGRESRAEWEREFSTSVGKDRTKVSLKTPHNTNDVEPRLTKDQHDILEANFQQQNRPSTATKKDWAEALKLPVDKINVSIKALVDSFNRLLTLCIEQVSESDGEI